MSISRKTSQLPQSINVDYLTKDTISISSGLVSIKQDSIFTASSGNFTSSVQIGTNNLTTTNTLNIINSTNLYLWSNFR
jgi:hypothetical protein